MTSSRSASTASATHRTPTKLPPLDTVVAVSNLIEPGSGSGTESDEEYELKTVGLTPREDVKIHMPPIVPPQSPRGGLHRTYEAALQKEMLYWERKYLDDAEFEKKYPGIAQKYKDLPAHDPEFRRQIDYYMDRRQEVMMLKDDGSPPEELDPLFNQLGQLLAVAYGMVDPATGDWFQDVKDAARRGAGEYGEPSVWAFGVTLVPGFVKTLTNLCARFVDADVSSAIRHVTNFVYPFVQLPVSVWASQMNAYWQSGAVKRQQSENSPWTPNLPSSKILNEDGTEGKLRRLSDIHEDLKELREADQLIRDGLIDAQEHRRIKLTGEMLLAEGELQKYLDHVQSNLGTLLKSGKSAPLNSIEKKILDKESSLEARIGTLLKVTSGRTALSGLQKQRAQRLLEQRKLRSMLANELDAAINSWNRNVRPEPSETLRKALVDKSFEASTIFNCRMLNVMSSAAFVRHIRTAYFAGASIAQLSFNVAQYVTEDDGAMLAADVTQLLLTISQWITYAVEYPDAVAKDALNKLATQWKLIAMTGTGNFIGKDGKVDSKKLSKVATGLVMTRLSVFASLLEHDKQVYGQALLGWMVDPRTLDNDEAEKVTIRLPEADEDMELACTYVSLAEEFSKLKEPEDRKAFVDEISKQRPLAAANKAKVDRILALYEQNEINLKNKSDASKLLDEKHGTLPDNTVDMLYGSLDYVTGPKSAKSNNKKADRELFSTAGKIEQRNEVPEQPGQKLGQSFAWLGGGTGGFLLIKSIFTLGVEAALLHGELTQVAADELATNILAGKITSNIVALASTVFTLGVGSPGTELEFAL